MKVKYCGPAKDYSGYGEANRHDIGALVAAGVQVVTELPSYVNEISDYGRLGRLAVSLQDNDIAYAVKIIHTTPDQFTRYAEADKYNIGRVFWETDRIPEAYIEGIKSVQEIWTGSRHNAEAIKRAGVNCPIYIIPEAIDTALDDLEEYETAAEGYRFYSVFEWSERKNPSALLEAYWREFTHNDDVSLIIKTYSEGFQKRHKDIITQDIQKLKDKLGLDYYAPVYIYRELMDRLQVYRFHASFDCFVSAHRGEGWGIPQMEAMLLGKPVISTNWGGIHEYLEHKTNALLVKNRLVKVRGDRKWYEQDQNWAEVDLVDLQEKIRWAYQKKKTIAKIARAGQEFVKENFALDVVGKLMKDRLEEVQ